DWWYMHWGVFIYCIELWDLAGHAGLPRFDERGFSFIMETSEEEELKLLKWIDEELDGEGFMDWTPFEHPQLGEVEIGGWKFKYTWQNPPPGLLEEECERTYRFALKLAESLPLIEVSEPEVEEVDEGIYRVEMRVENRGFLPTNISEQALKMGKAKTVKAEIDLGDGVELVSGERIADLGHIEGRSDRLPGKPLYSASRGKDEESAKTVEWVLKADELPARSQVTVDGRKGGVVRREINLT
ncbi:MAG: carboxypeptidase, partial [Candidatus Bathyarchaeia archaeon]